MVEYASLMLGAVGLMFLLFETGFRLSTPGFITNEIMDLMDFIKMGFFFMALAMGFFIVGLMNIIVGENSASTNLVNYVGLGVWIWGIIFILSMFGFAIYFIWWIPKKAQEALKQKRESDAEL